MLWKLLSLWSDKFLNYIRWLVPDGPYLNKIGTASSWKFVEYKNYQLLEVPYVTTVTGTRHYIREHQHVLLQRFMQGATAWEINEETPVAPISGVSGVPDHTSPSQIAQLFTLGPPQSHFNENKYVKHMVRNNISNILNVIEGEQG